MSTDAADAVEAKPDIGAFAPLRQPVFRRIWSSSLLSNFGQLILGVGAAWEMARLTNDSADMVALVQTALMLPLMLVAVPAGAIADMFDRRKVAMAGLAFAVASAGTLTLLAYSGAISPWMLLGFCALIGAGVALYAPAWQASIREQVTPDQLPAAVALGSISYNVARSFGPAIGGVIVMVLGAKAAFGVNAVCYIPLLFSFFLWRRPQVPSRLPPERMDRAIVAGARYAIHSPPIRTVLIRALIFGLVGASVAALTPIIAREMLNGTAGTYGVLLGVYGVGAVAGALTTSNVREKLKAETAVALCAIVSGIAVIVMGLSHSMIITCLAMGVSGAAWMLLISLLNVGVQLSAPRWVTARALSWFQSALTGGIAFGAAIWGAVANQLGVGEAMVVSGVLTIASVAIGFILPVPRVGNDELETIELAHEPEVALALTPRSGPVVVEIDYRVDPAEARNFYNAMRDLMRARKRNGAFDWSIARDIADPEQWTERYHCPTWADYLRLRERFTEADRALQEAVNAYITEPSRVRRRLERPFGSVRWRADTPDPHIDPITVYPN
ncbi:MFS transporter [Stakelama tenebrarum]|uniref:MFS transporter n=1 Tax=Stakelama tenebrarum TaxID=2711215 RepID=A0A6G6Y817_9SPHN|nr:MFS transporter [Sphingosinithalassobacter tenebrarum]QIG80716.1 MFS transporter [Sphingosinithalassobacter tenebrarum]